ncbi:GNAT family N-acetyltransferase [Methylovirgula sp. 4M-Z18]|nr:GNAT family N-acetyltransferase [Methylovirgula sp. 4M-Z18]
MWPRISRAEWHALGKTGRRDAFHGLVEAGPPPGLLAYEGDKAVAWVSVGPRRHAARFHTAKNSALDDDVDAGRIFAITCFYVRSGYRKRGLTTLMARAAIAFAKQCGAKAVDVCAIEADRPLIWGDGFVGIASVFRKLGFAEIARRAPRRPLMRLDLARAELKRPRTKRNNMPSSSP